MKHLPSVTRFGGGNVSIIAQQQLCRNQNIDNGSSNRAYILENYKPQHGWDPPTDTKLILEGFPLYILLYGYLDFQKQLHRLPNIDTNTILCINTSQLHGPPTTQPAYVPLGDDFIRGKSPFEQEINPLDENRWYPIVQYQELLDPLILQ